MSSPAKETAIITGAAQGIGRAIAVRLAQDGYNVVVSDLSAQATLMDEVVSEIKANGGNAISIAADVSQEADVENLVQKAVSEFGGLDVVCLDNGLELLYLSNFCMNRWWPMRGSRSSRPSLKVKYIYLIDCDLADNIFSNCGGMGARVFR